MKNKEIEEILEGIKVVIKHNGTLEFDVKELKILLSYIEQLENDYKEANESITWWTNRFSAVERDKKQLKNNRDKAIEYIDNINNYLEISGDTTGYVTFIIDKEHRDNLLNILKGESDE